MIDINMLLQLDYLKDFVSKFYEAIDFEEKKKIDLYSLDMILSMESSLIIDLFNNYGLKCDCILEKKESDFLDDDWEFSDLFEEELSHASKEKSALDAAAWNEVLELNKKIDSYNEDIITAISALREQIRFVELIIKIFETDDLIYGDDINELKKMILLSPLIDDRDRFDVNLVIVNHLIESKKEIIFSKDNIETDEFENALALVHDTSTYRPSKSEDLVKLPYQEKILKYYVTYKTLIDDAGFANVFELMEASNDVFVDLSEDYLSTDDFCLQLGYLLYQLSHINDIELEKETLNALLKLDSLYKKDKKNMSKKNEMLDEIDMFSSRIDELDISLFNKLRIRLKVLKSNLNEIIGNERMNQLELEFNDIKRHIVNLTEILNLIKNVSEYDQIITDIYSSFNLDNDDSEILSSLQNKLSNYENEILSDRVFSDVSKEYYDCFIKIDEIRDRLLRARYVNDDTDREMDNILLKGFVLCDFDENNQPYILSDLAPRSKMIDAMIKPKELQNGFEAFNKLVNDLFLLGNTEKLNNNDSQGYNIDRLNTPVYWDTKSRTHDNETGMYRLRYDRNGVERFIEQRIVLHYGSVIYNQFVNIVREIIPNVYFDNSSDINLYINYASAMKIYDDSFYNVAINRFERKSSLYRLFNEPKNKTELSDRECELLKEIIHNSLDAFSKLGEINSDLHIGVIENIEGGRTRG